MFRVFIKKHFSHFFYFYSHLGYRVYIALMLSLVVGVLDGFGLAMFFPLLQMVGGDDTVDGEGLGGMAFLLDGLIDGLKRWELISIYFQY